MRSEMEEISRIKRAEEMLKLISEADKAGAEAQQQLEAFMKPKKVDIQDMGVSIMLAFLPASLFAGWIYLLAYVAGAV